MSSVASDSTPTKHPQTVHGPSDADCTQKQQERPEVTSIPVYGCDRGFQICWRQEMLF